MSGDTLVDYWDEYIRTEGYKGYPCKPHKVEYCKECYPDMASVPLKSETPAKCSLDGCDQPADPHCRTLDRTKYFCVKHFHDIAKIQSRKSETVPTEAAKPRGGRGNAALDFEGEIEWIKELDAKAAKSPKFMGSVAQSEGRPDGLHAEEHRLSKAEVAGSSPVVIPSNSDPVAAKGEITNSEQLVIDLARELYDRFVMGGWLPSDAHETIREMLAANNGKQV